MSVNLKRTLECMGLFDIDFVYFSGNDYAKYPAPRILSCSNVLKASWMISKKTRDVDWSVYDVILVGSFELLWPVRKIVGRTPTLICLDTTPVAARSLVATEQSSLTEQCKKIALSYLYKRLYGPIFRELKACFPRSHWCGQSLVEDFHVSPERIVPCYPPLDLAHWKPDGDCSPPGQPLRLLFVGNDFKRKGGEELLRLFQEVLQPHCELTIVSSDRGIDGRVFPSGVERYKNIPHEDMPAFFNRADVFLYPTNRDQFGMVVAEAMACGLPVLAKGVGGVIDVVKDGWNGYLFSYETPMEEWGNCIMELVRDRAIVNKMSRNARKLADQLFDQRLFDKKIQSTVLAVLAGERVRGGLE